MSARDAFERALAAIHDAMLDDARWPVASALLDEACGTRGNALFVAEGPKDDIRGHFVGLYQRGQRHQDLERMYLVNYYPTDEAVPRFRQLPDGGFAHVRDLYTAEELKSSPAYNEALPRGRCQDACYGMTPCQACALRVRSYGRRPLSAVGPGVGRRNGERSRGASTTSHAAIR